MRFLLGSLFCVGIVAASVGAADTAGRFNLDPKSPVLQRAAKRLEVDESQYGAGPLRDPKRTFYVSLGGDDGAEGRTWATAWRHVARGMDALEAGDTLVIDEGEYVEPILGISVKRAQSGKPGQPIVITAGARARVEITGAFFPELGRTPGTQYTHHAKVDMKLKEAALYETDTLIRLQPQGDIEHVDELPGTYCHDASTQRLYVHFSDGRGPDAHRLAVRLGKPSTSQLGRGDVGVDVRGSYVIFRGLWFKHYRTAMAIRGNRTDRRDAQGDPIYEGGDHVTIEDCAFFSTDFAGLVLYEGARWNLVKSNYGVFNGGRGSILMNHGSVRDNLILGNWLDASPKMMRLGGDSYYYGICNYGRIGLGTRVVRNVMTGSLSFRSKYMSADLVLQDNVMLGAAVLYPMTYAGMKEEPFPDDQQVIFRNNTLLGGFSTCFHPFPEGGAGINWCDGFKIFVNNFWPGSDRGTRAERMEAVQFADPAYHDYRLQATSPLRRAALGRGDVGARGRAGERVLFVGPAGNDEGDGKSVAGAWRSLARGTRDLRSGDTLYLLPGTYGEVLTVDASGTADSRICVRSRGGLGAVVPKVVVRGAHVTLERITVTGGAIVHGKAVVLKDCLIRDHAGGAGAALLGENATLAHCTVVGNAVGVQIGGRASRARVRDCVVALCQKGCLTVEGDAGHTLRVSHTCWHGAGAAEALALSTRSCVAADPGFIDRDKHDYRVRWDSPAARLAPFARAAGCFGARTRIPEVRGLAATSVQSGTAVLHWATPLDDTTCSIFYRAKGAGKWEAFHMQRQQGTVHQRAVTGLKPGGVYECYVRAKRRWGGETDSAICEFTVCDKPRPSTVFHIRPDGDDRADGRSPETAWRTSRRAALEMGPGDTLLFAPGVYHQTLNVALSGTPEKRVVYKASAPGEVVFDARDVLGPFLSLRRINYVTFDGFTFANAPREGGIGAYFMLQNCRGLSFLRCRVGWKRPEGGFSHCFILGGCPDFRLEYCVIWGTRYHVTSSNCSGMLLRNNTFARGQVYSLNLSGRQTGARIVNNIWFYPTSVPNAAIGIRGKSPELELKCDHNFFGPMRAGTHVAFVHKGSPADLWIPGNTLAIWQKRSGCDTHSLQGDPKFVNPTAGDFRLSADSPAIGAGEGGANMGACPVDSLAIEGKRSLLPGEGRTMRLTGRLVQPGDGRVAYRWVLPDGTERRGATLDYTPADNVNRFELRVLAKDATGAEYVKDVQVSVPPVGLAHLADWVHVEAEDFVAQGGGEVNIYKDAVNASGTILSHWNRSTNHWLEWQFAVPTDGDYEVFLRYTTRLEGRRRSLTIDGKSPGPEYDEILFEKTGGWAVGSDTWAFRKLGPPVRLAAGTHRLRMVCLNSAINVDYLVLARTKPAPAAARRARGAGETAK